MDPEDPDEASREDLESRVAELEQTVSKMLPDRRGVLKGLGAAAIGAGVASSGASGQSAAGQVGTESEPVDVEGAQGNFNSVNTEELNNVDYPDANTWEGVKALIEHAQNGDSLAIPNTNLVADQNIPITASDLDIFWEGPVVDVQTSGDVIRLTGGSVGVSMLGSAKVTSSTDASGSLIAYRGCNYIDSSQLSIYAEDFGGIVHDLTRDGSSIITSYLRTGKVIANRYTNYLVDLTSSAAGETSMSVQLGDIIAHVGTSVSSGGLLHISGTNDVSVGRLVGEGGSHAVHAEGPLVGLDVEHINTHSNSGDSIRVESNADGQPERIDARHLASIDAGGHGVYLDASRIDVDFLRVQNSNKSGVVVADESDIVAFDGGSITLSNRDSVKNAYDLDIRGSTSKKVSVEDVVLENDGAVNANINWGDGSLSEGSWTGGLANNSGDTKANNLPRTVENIEFLTTEVDGTEQIPTDVTGQFDVTVNTGVPWEVAKTDVVVQNLMYLDDRGVEFRNGPYVQDFSGDAIHIRGDVATAGAAGSFAEFKWRVELSEKKNGSF